MLREGQRRFTGLSRACASCHRDPHEGSFGASCAACHGQADPFKEAPSFSHDSFALQGAHAGLECRRCHEVAGPTAVATLQSRAFIPRTCVGCHEDVHEGALGEDCASCHGTERPFNQAARFTHTAEFPLSGGHGGIACRDCHAKDTPYSINALRVNARSPRDCAECHASPHRPSTVAELARADRVSEAATCVLCHSPDNTTFLGGIEGMTPTRHRATGFGLGPPHDTVSCAACHAGFGEHRNGSDPAGFARSFPGRSAEDCASCHKDPHEGQFDGGPTLGRCIACHEATHFNPSSFDSGAHSRSRFPLGGAHRAVGCTLCHPEVRGVRRFATTPTECASCHEDVHGGRFEGPTRPRSIGGRTGCARCHNDAAFTGVDWTADQHGRWTGYELRGGHAAAACTECHRRSSRPDARGMSLGVAPKSCNACHEDPHAGQFARGTSTDCARCHVDSAPFTATTFDHGRDSAFQLDEHHATLACASCHKAAKSPQGATVTRYRPLGTTCQDCHGSGTPRARGGT
jgi:predicted CXXCH cytochrome family protein